MSLICCITDIPGINREIVVFNDGIQADPIPSVINEGSRLVLL